VLKYHCNSLFKFSLEQLEKVEPPSFPKTYSVYLAIHFIVKLVQGLYDSVMLLINDPIVLDRTINATHPLVRKYDSIRKMLIDASATIQNCLTLLSIAGISDELYELILCCIEKYTILVGLIELDTQRDLILTTLFHLILKSKLIDSTSLITKLPPGNDFQISDRNIKMEISAIRAMKKIVVSNQIIYLFFYQLMKVDLILNGSIQVSPTNDVKSSFLEYAAGRSEYSEKDVQLYKSTLLDYMKQVSMYQSFVDIIRVISRLCEEALIQCSGKESCEVTWSLSKLHDIAVENIDFLFKDRKDFLEFSIISTQFINVAHSVSCGVETRLFACTVYGDALVSISQSNLFQIETVEMAIVNSIKTLMALGITDSNIQDNIPFLPRVRRLAIKSVFKMMQTSGQDMKYSWVSIIYIIKSSFKSVFDQDEGRDKDSSSRVGFQCVQLICTEFLESLNPIAILRLIDVISCFGSDSKDTNTSLSAIGLLWTVYDFIITKRQTLSEIEYSGDANSTIEEILSCPLSWKTMDTLWTELLRRLSILCLDPRPDIRNSANQTLFRTISMNGDRLTLDSWDICITNVLFPLLEKAGENGPSPQWDETRCLNLNSVTDSFINHLAMLTKLGTKFHNHWSNFLVFLKDACLSTSPIVSKCAIDNIKKIVDHKKLASENLGTESIQLYKILFSCTQSIGQGVLTSCEASIKFDDIINTKSDLITLVTWTDSSKPILLAGKYKQAFIAVYITVLVDVYRYLRTEISMDEFHNVCRLLKSMLLYHYEPRIDATKTEIRVDAVNDLYRPTGSQDYILQLFKEIIDIEDYNIVQKSMVLLHLADIFVMPFIPFGKFDDENVSFEFETENIKKHTFMAISRQSLIILESAIQNWSNIFELDTLSRLTKVIIIPVLYKYDIPLISKDDGPLWQLATQSILVLLKKTLFLLGSDKISN
jgi:hypothetical protein